MLDRFRMSTDPRIGYSVAWWSVLAVSEEPDLSEIVRLAELGVNGAPEHQKAALLNTLGAALYRAGRFAEAVRRLDEGIQKRNGESIWADWVFLAMAHHRLGHHDKARRWLDRFRDRSPNLDPSRILGRARDPLAPGRGGGGGPLGPDLPGRSLRVLSQYLVQFVLLVPRHRSDLPARAGLESHRAGLFAHQSRSSGTCSPGVCSSRLRRSRPRSSWGSTGLPRSRPSPPT